MRLIQLREAIKPWGKYIWIHRWSPINWSTFVNFQNTLLRQINAQCKLRKCIWGYWHVFVQWIHLLSTLSFILFFVVSIVSINPKKNQLLGSLSRYRNWYIWKYSKAVSLTERPNIYQSVWKKSRKVSFLQSKSKKDRIELWMKMSIFDFALKCELMKDLLFDGSKEQKMYRKQTSCRKQSDSCGEWTMTRKFIKYHTATNHIFGFKSRLGRTSWGAQALRSASLKERTAWKRTP